MPPDLNEVARPVATPSTQNCEEAAAFGLSVPRPSENGGNGHQVNCGAQSGKVEGRCTTEASNVVAKVPETANAGHPNAAAVNKYFLMPELRAVFAAVGAGDKAYSFKEILGFLKAYLYSKRYLFDESNILYVNCKSDDLGFALKVDRFHYNDVRSLLARNVIPESKGSVKNLPADGQGCSLSANGTNINLLSIGHSSASGSSQGVSGVASANGCANPSFYVNNDKTTSEASDGLGFPTQVLPRELQGIGLPPSFSLPGSSRQSTESTLRHASSLPNLPSYPLDVKIPLPEIPDGNSDSESVYSYQGYETVLCHNTEYEESEDEIEFEEYELASEEEDAQVMDQSDDSDSMIEDVQVALLAVHALYEDEVEENFWADDSDTEDTSTDDDLELAQERWKCVTCGIRNKAFVRYCAKCWQVRKNWLPERPKKKRRKPRPKKKLRSPQAESSKPDGNANDVKRITLVDVEEHSSLSRGSSTSSTDSGNGANDLFRTGSTATTVSLENLSPRSYSIEQMSSQDSGICLSQDVLTESSQDMSIEDARPSCSKDAEGESYSAQKSAVGSCGSTGKSAGDVDYSSDSSKGTAKCYDSEQSVGESSTGEGMSKKRKPTPIKGESKVKRSKSSFSVDYSDEDTSFIDNESTQYKDVVKLLKTASQVELEEIGKYLSKDLSDLSDTCTICCSRPKNATIIHGRLSHQATCYQCARRLLNTGARCPVCRRKIHMVCKNIKT